MKKVILILLVGLLWCNISYAMGYKISLLEKNEYGIVFKITIPWEGDPFKWKNTFRKTRETSIQHCNTYNKDTYVFWSQYEGAYARDKEGKFYDDHHMYGPVFGIIQDLQYVTIGPSPLRARYFCAENAQEAYGYLERYDDLFKKKFKTKMYTQSMLYSKINDDPFNFKNLDDTDATLNVSGDKAKKTIKKKSAIKKSAIEEFKEICTDLGLTHGTSEYVDCVLKLKSDEEKMIMESQRLESEEGIAEDKQEFEEEKYTVEQKEKKKEETRKKYDKCRERAKEDGLSSVSCELILLFD